LIVDYEATMDSDKTIKELRRAVERLQAENADMEEDIKQLRNALTDTEQDLEETRYALAQTRDQLTAYECEYK
jgi:septal ring factor EnvC (AmiA/AmiB activator)